jgi:laminin, alpha 1/2
MRSYFPTTIGVTTSNHIIVTFALNSRKANSPLLFIQGEEEKFIALEMVNRKVLLLWNFGDDSGTVAYPTEIEMRDPKYDDAWYKVEVIRSLNVGSLSVSRMTNSGNFENSTPITSATSINSTRFVISQNNRIYVGGVPDSLRPKDLKTANGLSVIVHQLFVDNYPVGLWHFASSDGMCEGAMLGPTETTDSSIIRHFNGHGYSVVRSTSTRPYKKERFSLQMTFKTLDENALLFLTVDEKNVRGKFHVISHEI